MTVTGEQEIARYVEEVRRSLADLPPSVRDELLEDLPEHLTEVAAEGSGSLSDRLGPAAAYAAELRAAAGIHAPAPAARNLDDRIAAAVAKVRRRLGVLDVRVGPVIGYAKASDFLRLLRPAWWVLRGYLIAMLVSLIVGGLTFGLLPTVNRSLIAGLLLLALAVVGSIWLGRRGGGLSRWPRLAANAGSALAVVFGLAMLVNYDGIANRYPDYAPAYNPDPYSNVQDVFVYDGEGRLIEGARLFDQDGSPIRLGYPSCPEAEYLPSGEPVWRGYPYCPGRAPFRLTVPPAPVTQSVLPPSAAPVTPSAPPPSPAPVPSPSRLPTGAAPAQSAT